jgi:uncharacterized OB-fold protein
VPDTKVTEVLEQFPDAWIDRDDFAMFEGFLGHKLLINQCQNCNLYFQPPWPSCPNCWSDQVVPTEVSGRGSVHTFVILHTGALWGVEGVDYVKGHPLLVVQLEEQDGLRVTGPMVECANEDIRIGMPVSLTWIERQGHPVPAFQPA